ncbi:glutamate-cysteine ligase family protein [Pseudonocardia sp.]|uniref:glutamate-cysteine ligase family protein n=1 Tax=Pseudonocardia sp. TaxID=60912 RepID=UPI0026125FE6|nr:glutamate-cysteine ligase family protein [Pseudonocardia sp.]
MGRDVEHTVFTREDRRRFRDKIRRCLDALDAMLRDAQFEFERPLTGMEIELNLVDDVGEPANVNAQVLELLADPDFQTEMGRFNVEINMAPREIRGTGLAEFEAAVRSSLNAADERARLEGGRLVMTGMLPTLMPRHVGIDALSANPRYAVLNDQIFAARGEDMALSIDGVEQLRTYTDSITPEAACTSVQLHLQVSPAEFAAYWNAAQAVSGVQLALGANSPFLFGTQLWRETRIPLFEQVTDTRPQELKEQGVRPRVWFGERWITSVFDLFEENARYFPALLPVCEDDDPMAVLDAGGVPRLEELSLHNGTVYRWNRPIYAVVDGRPHLRVENRVLPAGPTVVDTMANAAFYYGLVRALADQERPLWSQMSFSAAEENFHSGARHGIDAGLYWPGLGPAPATELVLRRLLPLAHAGLDAWGVAATERDRLLGVIEGRCVTGVNGAAWQASTVHELEGGGMSRIEALHEMLRRYVTNMHSNRPVHTWAHE